jgi:hypothetical protein
MCKTLSFSFSSSMGGLRPAVRLVELKPPSMQADPHAAGFSRTQRVVKPCSGVAPDDDLWHV